MEKKLSLSQLKVKSFITSLNGKESRQIKGGTLPTDATCNPTLVTCSPDSSKCSLDPDCHTNTGTTHSDTGCISTNTDGGGEGE